MVVFDLIQGETKTGFSWAVKDSAGAAIDISGSTIVFTMNDDDYKELLFSKSVTIDNGAGGLCSYSSGVGATDWSRAGTFSGELKITFSDGRVLRKQDITINVAPKARTT